MYPAQTATMISHVVHRRVSMGAFAVSHCSVSYFMGSESPCMCPDSDTRLRPGDMHGKCQRKYKEEGKAAYGQNANGQSLWVAMLSRRSAGDQKTVEQARQQRVAKKEQEFLDTEIKLESMVNAGTWIYRHAGSNGSTCKQH